ncbi:MAG: 3-deoxy-7-phosphoheptulonate synthase [Pseudomonadota bacterium]
MQPLDNLHIAGTRALLTPAALKAQLPQSEQAASAVQAGRHAINAVLERRDPRLLVVVGPCSIHDLEAAREYARRLRELSEQVSDSLLLVMRVYFEKPRTTTGWKGLINDPRLDDSFAIEEGLTQARALLLELCELGLPLATEALDPITPQYLQDLISWSAIGARTTESQTHREMASGLSCAVGFKNGTDGSLDVAINALQSAASPHRFLGIDHNGQVAVIETSGNPRAHVVLRGGSQGPNFDRAAIADCEAALGAIGAQPNIMVDCSHANSSKQHERQIEVARDVAGQIAGGSRSLIGIMLESHLHGGRQNLADAPLRYGVSITDACISWEQTEVLLKELGQTLRAPLAARDAA